MNFDKDYYDRLNMIKSQRSDDLDVAWLLDKVVALTNSAKWDMCPNCAVQEALIQGATYSPSVLADGWYDD